MPIETVTSWRELDDAIANRRWCASERHVHSTLVFRGLARADYPNVSSLSRLSEDSPGLERHLIRNFRKYAHRASPGPTMWDWLSLAQHHGLPTRLLDWTFSAQVALHFATASWGEQDAILWAVDCEGVHRLLPDGLREALDAEGSLVFTTELLAGHAPDLERLDALTQGDEPFALFFEPPSLDERIVNQAAVLSAISDPRCQMDEWLEDHPDLWRAWRIPAETKGEIRERLDEAHVNERILLPGLDGIAAWLRRYYSPSRVPAGGAMGGGSMAGGRPDPQEDGAMG
jgi:FRG domain